jgi:CRISPR-associated protein Csd1
LSSTPAFAVASKRAFLERGSGHRVQIGDTTVVFWADASDAKAAEQAEGIFAALIGVSEVAESVEAKKVGAILQAVRQGRPIEDFEPGTGQGVRIFVLGLAPNAARLSVRFYVEDNFAHLERNLTHHLRDLMIEPWPITRPPSAWSLLNETCVHVPRQGPNSRTIWERSRNSQPLAIAGGDLMRAILTGGAYPRTLLSAIIQRISAESAVG